MRIVSDFDGVFTDQRAEAEAFGGRQVEVVAEAIGDPVRALALVTGLRAEVRAAPHAHGWVTGGGVLVAYADEDPYIVHTATGAALYARGPEDVLRALAALGLHDQVDFNVKCFYEGTERWRGQHPSHLLPEVPEALMAFANTGVEVAVVSNSSTRRIASILGGLGMERFGAWRPRLLGDAKKFELAPARLLDLPESLELAGRAVPVRRGLYYDALEREQPDLIIGDVLSMDLALPLALRGRRDWFDDVVLCLKQNSHTPGWALAAAREHGVRVVDGLLEAAGLLGL